MSWIDTKWFVSGACHACHVIRLPCIKGSSLLHIVGNPGSEVASWLQMAVNINFLDDDQWLKDAFGGRLL